MRFLYEDNDNNEYIITYVDNDLDVLDFWLCDTNSVGKLSMNNTIDYTNYQIIISHEEEKSFENIISDRYLIRLLYLRKQVINNDYKLNNEYNIVKLTKQNIHKYENYFNKVKELTPYKEKLNNSGYYIFLLFNKFQEIIGVSIYKDFSKILLLEYYYIDIKNRGRNLGKYIINVTINLLNKNTDIMANVESTNLSSYKTLINSGFKIFNKKSYISYR